MVHWSVGVVPESGAFFKCQVHALGWETKKFPSPLPPLVSKYPWKFVLVLLTPLVAPFEAFFEKKTTLR